MNAPGNYPNHGSHLREVGRFLRRFRNAVLSFELRPGARWHHEPIANPNSHICHNDIAPKVTVFRDGEPVAFLDWDFAHLGQAMWVVAHAAWQFGGSRAMAAAHDTAGVRFQTASAGCVRSAILTVRKLRIGWGSRKSQFNEWKRRPLASKRSPRPENQSMHDFRLRVSRR